MKNINTQKYWDKIYSNPKTYEWREYPKANKLILKEIGKRKIVTEVGCGNGVLLEQIKQQGNYVTGLDISQKAVDICKEKGIKVFCHDFLKQEIKVITKKEDYLVATEFLEHFPPEQTTQILEKMKTLANKVILVVPNNCLYPIECEEHYNFFTETTIKEEMEKVFSKVKVKVFDDPVPNTNIILPSIMVVCQ